MQNLREKVPGSDALATFCEKAGSEREITDELRRILEVTATTGKYWHNWGQLRVLLGSRLSQLLQDFHNLQHPEGIAPLFGPLRPETEPFPDMMERLAQYMDSFTDGAPFTFQRLCEILLCPKDTYNNLDKLALAFEKLLLVQSTYPESTDPYPLRPLPSAARTDVTIEKQKTGTLDTQSMNGAHDSIESLNGIPVIDEEMVDVERVLDAQGPGEVVASSHLEVLHEHSVGELPQAPETSSEMSHASNTVDLPKLPETSPQMSRNSSDVEEIRVPGTTSDMLLETIAAESCEAPAANVEMLQDSAGPVSSQLSGTDSTVVHYLSDPDSVQATDTNPQMLRDSAGVQLPQLVGSSTEMLQNSPSLPITSAVGSSIELRHDSSVVDLPVAAITQVLVPSAEMLPDSSVVDVPAAPSIQALGTSTSMLLDPAVVDLPPAPTTQLINCSSDMLHDSAVVALPPISLDSTGSIGMKLHSLEPVNTQIDSAGMDSTQPSERNVDMKPTGPEELVKSYLTNPEKEDIRQEDVSMGMVS